ncbi:MAG: hypothetical protein PCFJNLEI_02590 [Verrucomicrobiae bacterium]|nr:hypothetical protein [Verrucomicrobiae bacterium]
MINLIEQRGGGRLALLTICGAIVWNVAVAAPVLLREDEVDEVIEEETWRVPPGLFLRARVLAAEPAVAANMGLRCGSEGLGGKQFSAVLASNVPVGEWSEPIDLGLVARQTEVSRRWFLTVTGGRAGKYIVGTNPYEFRDAATNVVIEIEFSWKNQVLKSITQSGPGGGTVGVVVPAGLLTPSREPSSPEFVAGLLGLREYADRRLARFAEMQKGPPPKLSKYTVSTDINGYGTGIYRGIRYTDPQIIETEAQAARHLGVNALRGMPRKAVPAGFAAFLPEKWIGFPVTQYNSSSKKNSPDAGCPFSPATPALTEEKIQYALSFTNESFRAVWLVTRDEIGLCIDQTADGKAHPSKCPHCRTAFADFLRAKGLRSADFGKADWSEVVPLDIFNKTSDRPWLNDPHLARQAYWSRQFNLYSTAKLFTPIRDALRVANADKRNTPVYSYALRAPSFLWRGHSLDLFEFYRHADNAFVYETSNRDRRVDVWDSYLCDVGRVVAQEYGLMQGVYVKPHRGSPVQRTLTAAARGAQHFQWYTYGPDYAMGDSFLGRDEHIAGTMRAANLLAKGEAVLYGAKWAVPAEIAIVKPLSSEIWMQLSDYPLARVASFEDAKWVYTALAHAHLPVDPLDEGLLETRDLSRYKVIYVTGQNITRKAAGKLADWVKAGGTLVTTAGGLARDEANQPLPDLLGLKARTEPEMWYKISSYGASQLGRIDERNRIIAPVPDGAEVAKFKPQVGREILQPADKTEVIARFADGGAAVVRHAAGKGQAYIIGFFAGLEYATPIMTEKFNMADAWNTAAGRFLTAPALERVQPVVEPDSPLVEGVLVKTDKSAVVLMNWGYRTAGHRTIGKQVKNIVKLVPQANLAIRVRGTFQKATSLATGTVLPVRVEGGRSLFTLPALQEGDIITLD